MRDVLHEHDLNKTHLYRCMDPNIWAKYNLLDIVETNQR